MNAARRKEIARAVSLLQEIADKFTEAKDIIETLKDEEREAFDNLSEGLQQSDRGQLSEQAAGNLEDAFDSLDGVDIDQVIAYLESAAE